MAAREDADEQDRLRVAAERKRLKKLDAAKR